MRKTFIMAYLSSSIFFTSAYVQEDSSFLATDDLIEELNEKIFWEKGIVSQKYLDFILSQEQSLAQSSPPSSDVQNLESAPTPSAKCQEDSRPFRVLVKHIEGGGIGYNQGYSTLGGFFSLNKYSVIPFVDLRGHVFNDGKFAANAGFGVRGLLRSIVLGMHAYYDYRQSSHQHYNQVGLGLEVLSARWEGRVNGYLPFGRKKSSPFDKRINETISSVSSSSTTPFFFDSFRKHHMLISQQTETLTTTTTTTRKKDKIEFAMKGVDAEIGYHVFRNKHFDVFTGIGPYYFKGYFDKKAIGGKARLTANLSEYFYATGIYSNDSLFHSRLQGEVGINIPFGRRKSVKTHENLSCNDVLALNERLVQPVNRQEIIVLNRHQRTFVNTVVTKTSRIKETTSIAINPNTGLPWHFQFVNNQSSSTGTFESPFNTLLDAQNASLPFDVIYVFAGDKTTTGMNQGIVLQNNQKLFGSGVSHELVTTKGSIEIPALSHSLPSIANSTNTVVLADNNEVSGFKIFSGGNGIVGNTITNAAINNNIIEASNDDIHLFDLFGVGTIENNIMQGHDGIALSYDKGQFHVTIRENQILNAPLFSTGIIVLLNNDANGKVKILDNNLMGESQGMSLIPDQTSVLNLVISNNKGQNFSPGRFIGMEARGSSSLNVILTENQLTNSNSQGITFITTSSSIGTINAVANTITGANSSGLFIQAKDSSTLSARLTENNSSAIGIPNSGYELDNLGATSTFFLQSPNGALSGVESLNTGTFSTTGTITFIPFQD